MSNEQIGHLMLSVYRRPRTPTNSETQVRYRHFNTQILLKIWASRNLTRSLREQQAKSTLYGKLSHSKIFEIKQSSLVVNLECLMCITLSTILCALSIFIIR